jgi:membrane associated rhomboid family serine protease
VAYFAHIGGFVTGLVLVWFFRNEEAHRRQLAAREGHRAFQRLE